MKYCSRLFLLLSSLVIFSCGKAITPPVTPTSKTWNTQVLISDATSNSSSPVVSMDDAGNALAVWLQKDRDTTILSVMSAFYNSAEGRWETIQSVEGSEYPVNFVYKPILRRDDIGNFFLAWIQSDSNSKKVFVNRYHKDSGWDTAIALSADDAIATNVHMAVSKQGNAIVAWDSSPEIGGDSIQYATFNTTSSWGQSPSTFTRIGKKSLLQSAEITVLEDGKYLFTWFEVENNANSIRAAMYSDGAWVDLDDVVGPTSTSKSDWRMVSAENGNAVIVWSEDFKKIYGKRFILNVGWSENILLSESALYSKPTVGIANNGKAVVWWTELSGQRSRIYDPITGWQTENSQHSDKGHPLIEPSLSMNKEGFAVGIYVYNGINAKLFEIGSWSHSSRVDDSGSKTLLGNSDVHVNNGGNAIVVWQESGEVDSIHAAQFRM